MKGTESSELAGAKGTKPLLCPFSLFSLSCYLILGFALIVLAIEFFRFGSFPAEVPSFEDDLVYFGVDTSLVSFSLDTGQTKKIELGSEVISYNSTVLTGYGYLLSFVDEGFKPGFVLLDANLVPRIAVSGMTAWTMGKRFVLGVLAEAPIELASKENAVELWDVSSMEPVFSLNNTLVLTPIGLAYGKEDVASEDSSKILLFTYTPEPSPLYPYGREGRFRLLFSESGDFIWSSDVEFKAKPAAVDLIHAGEEYLLLGGPIDYENYLYISLSAKTGELKWQSVRNDFPLTKPIYPYEGTASVLLLTQVSSEKVTFPAFSSRLAGLWLFTIDLAKGEFALEQRAEEMKELSEAYLALFKADSPAQSRSYNLPNGVTLEINDSQVLSCKGKDFSWEISLAPDFGTNLSPKLSGEKYLLLLEEPKRPSHITAQGIPHIVELGTGKRVNIGLGSTLKYLSPLRIGNKLILLTKKDLILLSEDKLVRKPLRLKSY